MANISNIKKVPVSIQGNPSGSVVPITILWQSPFFDTNYAISITLENTSDLSELTLGTGYLYFKNMINVTPAGCTVLLGAYSPTSAVLTGVVHAIASHQ
jgi:hypothetical protein